LTPREKDGTWWIAKQFGVDQKISLELIKKISIKIEICWRWSYLAIIKAQQYWHPLFNQKSWHQRAFFQVVCVQFLAYIIENRKILQKLIQMVKSRKKNLSLLSIDHCLLNFNVAYDAVHFFQFHIAIAIRLSKRILVRYKW
jgi:hypothetical protein